MLTDSLSGDIYNSCFPKMIGKRAANFQANSFFQETENDIDAYSLVPMYNVTQIQTGSRNIANIRDDGTSTFSTTLTRALTSESCTLSNSGTFRSQFEQPTIAFTSGSYDASNFGQYPVELNSTTSGQCTELGLLTLGACPGSEPTVKTTGTLTGGETVTIDLNCTYTSPDLSEFTGISGQLTFQQPACPQTGQDPAPSPNWSKLKAATQAAVTNLYGLIAGQAGCYTFTSGYRSEENQQHKYDVWHQIVDPLAPFTDMANQALKNAGGFAQRVSGWDAETGIAKGGPAPAATSRHVAAEAVDMVIFWLPGGTTTANYPQTKFGLIFMPLLQALAKQAGLCGPPKSDPVHVETKYAIRGATVPACSEWTQK
jgi:hypothetical protein